MSGFDVAAGAVGFASLGVLLLQGCVQGFILLSTAQNFGQDADLVRCEIEFEQYRLFRWAEKVGLEGNGSPNVPSRSVNWELINKFLRQLNSLMNETTKFKEEYGLELVTTEEELSTTDLDIPRKGLRKLIASIKPEFHSETARSMQKGVRIWKRLKWAAIDKAGIAVLISDIRGLVDKLYDLLLDDDREFVRSGIEALLRHVVSQATTSSELTNIEQLLSPKHSLRSKFEDSAVKTALGMKQKRLMLGFSEDSKPSSTDPNMTLSPRSSSSTLVASRPVSPSPGSRRPISTRQLAPRGPLSYKLLKRSPDQSSKVLREMGHYENLPVLIEWKVIGRGLESKLKHRVKSLAALLQDVESPNFRSLNCLGYLKDPGTGNYGYIFKLPVGTLQNSLSLTDLLGLDTMTPSLNDRIGLGIALAETMLQLHTSGWLHKGVRSDNILFFPKKAMEADLLCSFLEGYEFARADNPSDMTESPAHQQEANLYRHPSLLRSDPASFRKEFDLYALGCVLIEIGLWIDITTVLLHFLRKERKSSSSLRTSIPAVRLSFDGKPEMADVNISRSTLLCRVGRGSISEALEFATGKKFAAVVRACLSAGDATQQSDDGNEEEDDDDDDRCIDIELDILRELRDCII